MPVTISNKEYRELLQWREELYRMEALGVDNFIGMDYFNDTEIFGCTFGEFRNQLEEEYPDDAN